MAAETKAGKKKKDSISRGAAGKAGAAKEAARLAESWSRFVPSAGAKAAASLDRWFRSVGGEGGGETVGGELRVAMKVHEGFPVRAVEDVIDAGMIDPRALYEIVVARRTLAHRKQNRQPLSPEQSDRLARVFRIYSRAAEALGSLEKASRWLHRPNRSLQGQRPIDLLGSDAGSRAVEKILGRIEHGVFS